MHHDQYVKNHDALSEPIIIPAGSKIVMQCKDSLPWTHGMIKEYGEPIHSRQSYQITVTRLRHISSKNSRHAKKCNDNRTIPLRPSGRNSIKI